MKLVGTGFRVLQAPADRHFARQTSVTNNSDFRLCGLRIVGLDAVAVFDLVARMSLTVFLASSFRAFELCDAANVSGA